MESSGVGLFSCELLVYGDWPTFGRKPGTRGQDAQPPAAVCFIATRIPWSCEEGKKGWDRTQGIPCLVTDNMLPD